MKLIAGLGNPGADYANTPHNVGFDVVDLVAARLDAAWKNSSGFNALVARAAFAKSTLWLIKPQTYMNLSGTSVAAMLRYYRGAPQDLIVVSDDADLALGRLRIRAAGGSGGHLGLASIIGELGSEEFPRVRLGVGRTMQEGGLKSHVLGKFDPARQILAERMATLAADAVQCLVTKGLDEAMNRYNGLRYDEDQSERPQ
ncbi:MAG: aminoacyl-tRNA hydrolase [Kiritimatiellae bacterium]|nr:aminoacyl-tRNA hydrolase [Kiritimatiellia bacterium]